VIAIAHSRGHFFIFDYYYYFLQFSFSLLSQESSGAVLCFISLLNSGMLKVCFGELKVIVIVTRALTVVFFFFLVFGKMPTT